MTNSPAASPTDYSNLDSDQRVKKTRASKPKVKTGCQTCKIRRVKCDETKPSCLRCVRFGHQCDGYSNKTPLKPTASKPSRTLVPKSPSSGSDTSRIEEANGHRSYHPFPVPQLCIAPKPSLFDNQNEYQAYQNFCSRTSAQLTSPVSVDLWNRLILQACESSPSIRHAVIAIGSYEVSSQPQWPDSGVGTLKHQYAFRQYSKATCLVRREVAGGICDMKTTMAASLLFYCFEAHHEVHDLAISQVTSGLKDIREWANSFYRTDESGRITTKISMDNSPVVEEDILRAFQNLEVQVMTFSDARNREAHEHFRHQGQSAINEMTTLFSNLDEARQMLELVTKRSMHWLRSTMHLHNFVTPASSPSSSNSNDGDDLGPCSLFFDTDPAYEDRMTTLREFERWDDAFRPLLNSSRSRSAPHSHFILASTLRLHWLAGYMSVASNNSQSNANPGQFTNELEELADIARLLQDQPEQSQPSGFNLDMQVIVPLMTVGWIYRHRGLRSEGIKLLLRSPKKEGVWDGTVVGRIMDWLCELEEMAATGGVNGYAQTNGAGGKQLNGNHVPEWAVLRNITLRFDTARKEASVSCLQPVRDSPNGEEIRREIVISW